MKLRTILAAMLLTTVLAAPIGTTAFASPTKYSTSTRNHKKNNRPKTVQVRSYKKKNGTVVKAHDRAAPR